MKSATAPGQNVSGHADSSSTAEAARGKRAERDAFGHLFRQLATMREHLLLYGSAQLDKGKAAARETIAGLIISVLAFVLVASLIATSAVLVLNGLTSGLERLFPGQSWIAGILVGSITLTLIGVGVQCAISVRKKRDRQKTVEKYEARQSQRRQHSPLGNAE